MIKKHSKEANIETRYLQKFDEVLEGVALDLGLHNLHHLLTDELLVRSLGIAGSLNLFLGLLRRSINLLLRHLIKPFTQVLG